MMWKSILECYIFFLWLWCILNCQCNGNKNPDKAQKNCPTTEAPTATTNEKRENVFEAASLSNDVESENHVIRSAPVATVLSCALECLSDSDCKSILVEKYHENESYDCLLISGRHFHGLTNALAADKRLYFIRKDINEIYGSVRKSHLSFQSNKQMDG